MIICYNVPEIWRVTDLIFISHFALFLTLLPPSKPKNTKFEKNETIKPFLIRFIIKYNNT